MSIVSSPATAGGWATLFVALYASGYVPGALHPIGSPAPEVERMRNWAGPALAAAATAARGFSRKETGRPVASERRPIHPAPNSVPRSASRRLSSMALPLETHAHRGGRAAGQDEGGLERIARGGSLLHRRRVVLVEDGGCARLPGVTIDQRHDRADHVVHRRGGGLAGEPVSYTHLRAHETPEHLVCRL